jgi:transposase
MVIADEGSLPVAVSVASASPHEVTLVADTLAGRFVSKNPDRLVADRAYDSDPLDATLLKQGIVLVAPHRSNRVSPATQDGRALRSYKRRWKIERTNAWLQNWRKLVTRYEYLLENFLAFVKLVCIMLLFKRYF